MNTASGIAVTSMLAENLDVNIGDELLVIIEDIFEEEKVFIVHADSIVEGKHNLIIADISLVVEPLLEQEKGAAFFIVRLKHPEKLESVMRWVGAHFKKTEELSGGQRQRVAIARALVTRPSILLSDEPTANLDSKTGDGILDLMQILNKTHNVTLIFATHDESIISRVNRVINLRDGHIVNDRLKTT